MSIGVETPWGPDSTSGKRCVRGNSLSVHMEQEFSSYWAEAAHKAEGILSFTTFTLIFCIPLLTWRSLSKELNDIVSKSSFSHYLLHGHHQVQCPPCHCDNEHTASSSPFPTTEQEAQAHKSSTHIHSAAKGHFEFSGAERKSSRFCFEYTITQSTHTHLKEDKRIPLPVLERHLGQHFFTSLAMALSSPSGHDIARVCCAQCHRYIASSKRARVLRRQTSLLRPVMSQALQPQSKRGWASIRTSPAKILLHLRLWEGTALFVVVPVVALPGSLRGGEMLLLCTIRCLEG